MKMKKTIPVLIVILMAGFAVLAFQNTAFTGGGDSVVTEPK